MIELFSPNTKLDDIVYDVTHFNLTEDVSNHQHDCIEMVFIVSGNAVQVLNGKRQKVYKGCATIIHPGSSHGFTDVHELELYNVSCAPDVLERIGVSLTFFRNKKDFFFGKNLCSSLYFNGINCYDLINLLSAMYETYWNEKKNEKRHSQLRSFFGILLVFLFQAYRMPAENRTMSPADIARYLELHFKEKITLADIAEKAGVSVSLILLRFREQFGTSPMKYLAEYRLKYAAELLGNTSLSVKNIADECGFPDSNYFIKCYKDYFGVSPARQRRDINQKM